MYLKKGIYINDSIHGLIPLSEYEKRIISSVGFNRLHDVYQNSTVYLTFPTNRTKRFEHSIGTMKLCSDMFFNSILNADPKQLIEFYNIFEAEYKKIIEEIAQKTMNYETKLGGRTPDKLPKIEFDKFRHSLIPHNVFDQYQVLHLILVQSIRVGALLHDIGHPPFSHVVEFALYEVCESNKGKEINGTTKLDEFLKTMSRYFEEGKKLHEEMGKEISDSILREIIRPISDDDEGYDENLFEVLIWESVIRMFEERKPFSYLHRIIDSSLDGDRLDYVTRDSLNSGIDAGKIDYNRIINDMQLIMDDHEPFFCVPLKAVNAVEDFIKRRYNIYRNIIYHHRVIKTDRLLESSVKDLVEKYLNKDAEQRKSTHKVLIPFDISGLWFPLGGGTTAEKSNALSQWNDSWLMTVLKQIFYTEYYRNDSIKRNSEEYVLKQKLSELLRNQKSYYSLIKRSENFKVIDDSTKNVLAESREEIMALVSKTNQISEELKDSKRSGNTATIDITGTLDFIDEILSNADKMPKGFLLSFVARRSKAIQIESFKKFVEDLIQEEAHNTFTNTNLYDTIVMFKKISVGLDKPIYFYNNKGKISTLDEVSGVSNTLRLDSDFLPVFYIYILIKDGDSIVKSKRDDFLQSLGTKIGLKLKRQILDMLNFQVKKMEDELCVK